MPLSGTPVRAAANAKLNLTLRIAGRRDDGYHDVEMVMQSVDLCDTVTVGPATGGGIVFSADSGEIPEGKDNSAFRAAELFFEKTGLKNPGIFIRVEKRIPVAAGLAGGSADAAGVLTALNELFSTGLSAQELRETGLRVGADVPFCLTGSTMLATGVGECLKPLHPMPPCFIVVAKPSEKVSTSAAYARFDETGAQTVPDSAAMESFLADGNLKGVAASLCNVFEEVLNLPSVNEIKRMMRKNGALGASMSGSGPSVFGLFARKAAAQSCLAALSSVCRETYFCRPADFGCKIL